MLNGQLVIDAVAHAYMFQPENRNPSCSVEAYQRLVRPSWAMFHEPFSSRADGYLLSEREYTQGWNVEEVASMFFEESDVDLAVYHAVNFPDFFAAGLTPFWFGAELKKAYPGRVMLFAPVEPVHPGDQSEALQRMEQHTAAAPVDGFKFYPATGAVRNSLSDGAAVFFDDEKYMFPYFEKARELGVPHIAVHKGIPALPSPIELLNPDDVTGAALAFPDLTFEVVHSGWAFLDESALQLMSAPNVFANLECVANFLVRYPRRFAQILGKMLQVGGGDQIIFGTGAVLNHPQPILDAFMRFRMPEDLLEEGLPEVTDDMKSAILGGNFLRMHRLDARQLHDRVAEDEWAHQRAAARARPPAPWRKLRERLAAGGPPPSPFGRF